MMPALRVTEQVRDEIKSMHDAGLAPAQIADELSFSLPTIYKVLRALGVKPRKSFKSKLDTFAPEDFETIAKRYVDGAPTLQLLADYEIHYPQLYQILDFMGVQPRLRQRERKEAKNAMMEHALQLYLETDLTVAEIVEETGVHQPVLHAELRKREIPSRRARERAKLGEGASVSPDDIPPLDDDEQIGPEYIPNPKP
jgi:IS30 family transposase